MVLGKIGIPDKDTTVFFLVPFMKVCMCSCKGDLKEKYRSNFFSFGIPNKDKTKFILQIKIGVADKDSKELVYVMRIGILD